LSGCPSDTDSDVNNLYSDIFVYSFKERARILHIIKLI